MLLRTHTDRKPSAEITFVLFLLLLHVFAAKTASLSH